MKILALESSAGTASVALCENEKILHFVQDASGHTHSETLLPTIVSALEKHRLTVKDIDLFAVPAGPGSYTGLRIGIATVKGLASGSGKPCVPVSSLEALARNAASFDGLICPVLDARREQMYSALFESKNGVLTRLTEDRLLPLCEIVGELKKIGRAVRFVGDGYDKALAAAGALKVRETPAQMREPSAYSVAVTALSHYREAPDQNYDESVLSPVYLRATQAERERLQRMEQN